MGSKSSQLRSLVLSALAKGEFAVGDKLPTESELIERYGFSRPTVREGLAALVQEGILVRKRGSGTFVASLEPTRRNKVIATMVPCCRGVTGVYDEIVRGVEDEANDHGYSLILCNVDNDPEKARAHIPRLVENNVAGLIYAPMVPSRCREANVAILDELENKDLLVVMVDVTISGDDLRTYSFVGTDGFAAMQELVKHLVAVGHRRIAYIRGFPGVYSSDQRYFGFVKQMQKEGLDLPEQYVKTIEFGPVEPQGRQEVRELMALDPRPTAVACLYDVIARNVMEEVRSMGLAVPEDVAVVGFDDLSFAAHLDPPLTTMRQPTQEEGRIAARLLFEKIEGTLVGERQDLLNCDLIVRGSCGAPENMRTGDAGGATSVDTPRRPRAMKQRVGR